MTTNFTVNQRTLIDHVKGHPNGDRVLAVFETEIQRRNSRPISLSELEQCDGFQTDHHAGHAYRSEKAYYVGIFRQLYPGLLTEAG